MSIWNIDWSMAHTDFYHPGSRDTCEHCQEMIRHFGPMPSLRELEQLDAEFRRVPAPGYIKAIIPKDLRWQVWERDNFTCLLCGSRRDLAVDHILAESKGGSLAFDNLQTLCKRCNSKKGRQ